MYPSVHPEGYDARVSHLIASCGEKYMCIIRKIMIIRSACSNSTIHPERKRYGYGTGKVQVDTTHVKTRHDIKKRRICGRKLKLDMCNKGTTGIGYVGTTW